jgi:hypothetical protein
MAFPVVQATNTSVTTPAATSHVISLPAGIVSGNLLLAIFGIGGNTVGSWPAGWTELWGTELPASVGRLECRYRIADGSEGATITVTTSGALTSSHTTYRIDTFSGNAPVAGTTATATSTNANPPSLTPSWGAKDTLWIAVAGVSGSAPSAAPANYTNLLTAATPTTLGSARRELNAATEDPGVFTSANDQWAANTIAVEPAAAAAETLMGAASM